MVHDIVYNKPEIVNRLLSIKNPDGSQYFDQYEILYRVLSPNVKTLLTEPEKVFAVLENPEELSALRDKTNNYFESGKLYWAIKHPLDSTRKANPGVFEPEPEVNQQSVRNSIININNDDDFIMGGLKVLEAHPELVDKLASLKDSGGHIFFDSKTIAEFLCNIVKDINNKSYMKNLNRMLNDSRNLSYIEDFMSRGMGLWRLSHE